MKYKFEDYQTGQHIIQDGYTEIVIIDGVAEIDLKDAAQLALAERKGGTLFQSKRKPAKKDGE